jgi:thioredoxin-like negative regulator of GroEL
MKKVLKIFIKKDCRECRLVKMKLDVIAKGALIDVKMEYIDVDETEDEAIRYSIQSVPTLLLKTGDSVVWRHVGNINYHELTKNIEA